jgi:hypothetical protein
LDIESDKEDGQVRTETHKRIQPVNRGRVEQYSYKPRHKEWWKPPEARKRQEGCPKSLAGTLADTLT